MKSAVKYLFYLVVLGMKNKKMIITLTNLIRINALS